VASLVALDLIKAHVPHMQLYTYGCLPICVNGVVDMGAYAFQRTLIDALIEKAFVRDEFCGNIVDAWRRFGERMVPAAQTLALSPSPQLPVVAANVEVAISGDDYRSEQDGEDEDDGEERGAAGDANVIFLKAAAENPSAPVPPTSLADEAFSGDSAASVATGFEHVTNTSTSDPADPVPSATNAAAENPSVPVPPTPLANEAFSGDSATSVATGFDHVANTSTSDPADPVPSATTVTLPPTAHTETPASLNDSSTLAPNPVPPHGDNEAPNSTSCDEPGGKAPSGFAKGEGRTLPSIRRDFEECSTPPRSPQNEDVIISTPEVPDLGETGEKSLPASNNPLIPLEGTSRRRDASQPEAVSGTGLSTPLTPSIQLNGTSDGPQASPEDAGPADLSTASMSTAALTQAVYGDSTGSDVEMSKAEDLPIRKTVTFAPKVDVRSLFSPDGLSDGEEGRLELSNNSGAKSSLASNKSAARTTRSQAKSTEPKGSRSPEKTSATPMKAPKLHPLELGPLTRKSPRQIGGSKRERSPSPEQESPAVEGPSSSGASGKAAASAPVSKKPRRTSRKTLPPMIAAFPVRPPVQGGDPLEYADLFDHPPEATACASVEPDMEVCSPSSGLRLAMELELPAGVHYAESGEVELEDELFLFPYTAAVWQYYPPACK
jgi:hypothetical protein